MTTAKELKTSLGAAKAKAPGDMIALFEQAMEEGVQEGKAFYDFRIGPTKYSGFLLYGGSSSNSEVSLRNQPAFKSDEAAAKALKITKEVYVEYAAIKSLLSEEAKKVIKHFVDGQFYIEFGCNAHMFGTENMNQYASVHMYIDLSK